SMSTMRVSGPGPEYLVTAQAAPGFLSLTNLNMAGAARFILAATLSVRIGHQLVAGSLQIR
ncbi:MAG: hypothetical protein ACHQ0J_11205, partial [Candidatus Dormibacterales bacterium]